MIELLRFSILSNNSNKTTFKISLKRNSHVSHLPKYKKITESFKNLRFYTQECTICLENYKIGEYYRMLPCEHTFHKRCIDKWLFKKMSCPICRTGYNKFYNI
jgi:hypothetical protein